MMCRIDGHALRVLLEECVGTSSASELAKRFGKNRVTYQRWFASGISTKLGWKKIKEIVCAKSDDELEALLLSSESRCKMGRSATAICHSLETLKDCENLQSVNERILIWQGVRILLTASPNFSGRELNAMIDAFFYAEQLGFSNGIPLPHFKETQSLLIRKILNLRKVDVKAFEKCSETFFKQKSFVKHVGIMRKKPLLIHAVSVS